MCIVSNSVSDRGKIGFLFIARVYLDGRLTLASAAGASAESASNCQLDEVVIRFFY